MESCRFIIRVVQSFNSIYIINSFHEDDVIFHFSYGSFHLSLSNLPPLLDWEL